MRYPPVAGTTSTATDVSASGWHSGMRSEVRLAAWMPAMRAISMGLPFFARPFATSRRAADDTRMNSTAVARRSVTGLSPTSTMRTLPLESTWLSVGRLRIGSRVACEIERESLERLRQVDALQLDVRRHGERAGREVEDRFHTRRHHLVDHGLSGRGGHRNHRDADAVVLRHLLELPDVVDGDAAARDVPDFLVQHVEERYDLEAFLPEARVIGQREPEVAGAHDRDTQLAIEAENLAQ